MHRVPKTVARLTEGAERKLHLGAELYVSLGQEVVADVAVGEATPGASLTSDHLMLWMSAGKPLTAVAALSAVAAGRLGLDEPVAATIPEFAQHGKAAVTLRHILTHTAGFRGPLNNYTPGTWDEILARVYALKQEPNWVPGEKAGYHIGSSWFVLGELLRRVGTPLEGEARPTLDFGERHVSLSMEQQHALASRLVPMYVTAKGELDASYAANDPQLMTVPRPGASFRGPVRTLGKFYEHLLRTRDAAGEWGGLIRAATSRQRVGLLDHTFKQTIDWGLGFMIDSKRYGSEHQYGFGPHASDDTFGHSGNQSSCAFADPKHGLVVAWCTNGMPGEPAHDARARAINAAIYEDLGLV
jgi:CubicO group peptidase (beta-lactamase class C family)